MTAFKTRQWLLHMQRTSSYPKLLQQGESRRPGGQTTIQRESSAHVSANVDLATPGLLHNVRQSLCVYVLWSKK